VRAFGGSKLAWRGAVQKPTQIATASQCPLEAARDLQLVACLLSAGKRTPIRAAIHTIAADCQHEKSGPLKLLSQGH